MARRRSAPAARVVVVPLPARPRRRHGAGVRPAHARGRPAGGDGRRDGRPGRRAGGGRRGSPPRGAGSECSWSTAWSRSTPASATASPRSSSAPATCCSRGSPASTICSSADGSCARSCPSRLALLDAAFAERVRPWPQISNVLMRRAGRRAGDLSVQRAITSQPRLEVRLTLLLWHLAGRFGPGRAGRHPRPAAAHPPAARPSRRRRAAVGVARARATVDGRPRHRARRRVASARDARPAHLAVLTDRSDERTAAAEADPGAVPAVTLQMEFTPRQGQTEKQLVHVHLDDERPLVRRRVGGAHLGDEPEPRGSHPGHDPGHAGHRHLQPAARLRVGRRLRQGLVRRRGGQARAVRARRRGLDPERAPGGRRPLGRVRGRSGRPASRSRPAVDRPARAEGRGRDGGRHLRGLRRRPRDEGQPDRRDGPRRLPRRRLALAPAASRS